MIAVGFGYYWLRTRGAWRVVYFNLFGPCALYMLGSLATNLAIARDVYYTGSLYDLPVMTVFFWYGMAGVIAFRKRNELDAPMEGEQDRPTGNNYVWATRFAMAAVLSLPLFRFTLCAWNTTLRQSGNSA